ncbi:MAG: dienelactone hydrolase family protein [Steroidobacteraceae bacterium]
MNHEYLDYRDGDLVCEGYVVCDETKRAQRPCVLVSHTWGGQSENERQIARDIAQLGYVAMALDVYGKGIRGGTQEENEKLMQPFIADRALLRRRLIAAVDAAKAHPLVDPDSIGIVGYCFGGLCALDLARSGTQGVRAAVSVHGIFYPPGLGEQERIIAKILVLHGYADPLAPPEHVLGLAKELTDAQADWQLHAYGHTMHAFTNPAANLPAAGMMYSPAAARRSWIAMKNFLEEVLGSR